MLPTFLICGAAKSGTTSLWKYVSSHPEVGVAPLKEPNFFSKVIHDGYQNNSRNSRISGQYWRGIYWYENLFRHCSSAKAVGEASVQYMTDVDAPKLISEVLPHVRLIFLLRDPIDRLISQYWQEVRDKQPLPSVEEMITNKHPALQRYIDISSYHIHLERFLRIFPRDQILVYLLDDLKNNPEYLIQNIYLNIGVNDNYLPSNLGVRYHKSYKVKWLWLQQFGSWLNWQWMSKNKKPWPNAVVKAGEMFMNLNRYPTSSPYLKIDNYQYLYRKLQPAIVYVEKYLSRSLPNWHSY
jgi:hypothetical protein